MPAVKYKIELSDADRKKLKDIVTKGKSSAKTILRANILLASDQQNPKYMTVAEIASIYHISATTVQNVRTSYATGKCGFSDNWIVIRVMLKTAGLPGAV